MTTPVALLLPSFKLQSLLSSHRFLTHHINSALLPLYRAGARIDVTVVILCFTVTVLPLGGFALLVLFSGARNEEKRMLPVREANM